MRYLERKKRLATRNTKPSLTEQSQANDTNINVIIKRYQTTGQVPGPAKAPIYGDFSMLPLDLRGFIEQGRSLRQLRDMLPTQLQTLSEEALLALTPEKINAILTPAETQPEEKK